MLTLMEMEGISPRGLLRTGTARWWQFGWSAAAIEVGLTLARWWLQIDAGRCWSSFLHPCEAKDRCRDNVDAGRSGGEDGCTSQCRSGGRRSGMGWGRRSLTRFGGLIVSVTWMASGCGRPPNPYPRTNLWLQSWIAQGTRTGWEWEDENRKRRSLSPWDRCTVFGAAAWAVQPSGCAVQLQPEQLQEAAVRAWAQAREIYHMLIF